MSADPMLPSSYLLVDKRQELEDTWTLKLEPAGGAGVGVFEPGQFSMLYALGAGEVPISVSSLADGRLSHTVRAVGATTRAICATETGDQLGVRGPYGNSWPLHEAKGVDAAGAEWHERVGLVTKLIPVAGFHGPRTTGMVCGPEVMMRFVSQALQDRGLPADQIHVSLERNMKCAVGHCGHCQLAHRFVCKDGPVFQVGRIGTLLGVREL
jgi:NAD(P)H-flavin reductase